MLNDRKLDSLNMHLEQFKLIDQNRQIDLENLLKGYSQLIDEYKTLRVAYDQQKNIFDQQKGSRASPPKQLMPAPPPSVQNPYVLMLVDGNGYIFNDELIREKEQGGLRAARMLKECVERYLQTCVPEAASARIVVRIYADLTTVSKQLGKSGVVGMEKRSIGSFSAAFTRAMSSFDFVDALDDEGTRTKINEHFKLATEDNSCRHIIYAACHEISYLTQLAPFSGLREKVTLVQGAGWNPAFHQFNLNVYQFPSLFRWSGLASTTAATKTQANNGTATIAKAKAVQKPASLISSTHPSHLTESWRSPSNGSPTIFGPSELSPTESTASGVVGSIWENLPVQSPTETENVCKFFQKGYCRFGNKCSFQHVGKGSNSNSEPATPSFKRNHIVASLPVSLVPGRISLNKDSQRIDAYVRPPTTQEWDMYNMRFQKKKPCNSWQMLRICKCLDCPYDHNELEPESRHVLEYVLRNTACPKRSSCRVPDCYYGHICQRDNCYGQSKGCRMKGDLHNVDPKPYTTIPAEEEPAPEEEKNGGLEMSDDENLMW